MRIVAPVSHARPASRPAAAPDALEQACRRVEGLFIAELLSALSRQTFGAGILGGGLAMQVLQAQRDSALAEEMGQRGELGLARLLYEQLVQADARGSVGAHKEEIRG